MEIYSHQYLCVFQAASRVSTPPQGVDLRGLGQTTTYPEH